MRGVTAPVSGPIADDPEASRHWRERLAMTAKDYAREADERDADRQRGDVI
ncbi:hypothetical protein Mth01_52560 [Sphaerimonospora thailandensis]|uniref:Uncharacterized protein n=1 Tax=Sphaerimonospora thailandensis TaxID=795644 RepID=A0A8J3RIK1_9ACTN|nr:hypothetical protein Mth01_52560 [Sphaerimonospora thailandensis]